jgi:hypothetical protein
MKKASKYTPNKLRRVNKRKFPKKLTIWKTFMNLNWLNVRENRWWCLFPLIVLLWHSVYVFKTLNPQYFFFVCYPANLILISGIALGVELFIGIGLVWVIVAFPLWLFESIHLANWELSCSLFHTTGLLVGLLSLRHYKLPRYTWISALLLGIFMQLLARRFTDESLNINAAFSIYAGWEGIFTSYTKYLASMLVGFGLFFYLFVIFSNRFFHGEPLMFFRNRKTIADAGRE